MSEIDKEIVDEQQLERPKKKRTYTPEQIEIMKENLRKGREKKAAAKETAKEVLELHSKLISTNKVDQVKEHLQSKLKEKDLEDKIVSLEKQSKKISKKKKPVPVKEDTDSESSSISDDELIIPPPKKIKKKLNLVKEPFPPPPQLQPVRSFIRFV